MPILPIFLALAKRLGDEERLCRFSRKARSDTVRGRDRCWVTRFPTSGGDGCSPIAFCTGGIIGIFSDGPIGANLDAKSFPDGEEITFCLQAELSGGGNLARITRRRLVMGLTNRKKVGELQFPGSLGVSRS
ncbi:hypothetical protein THTE_0790 [Thermogutta terrifontis]|uniref:Uncharacterized protein n=1 Tax=Thermogutta terrifontis TaxID=1331910 RepID=A0A286RBP7_9BACT|nr:hypothetical protein THTE_0790 [Thermogutta terrifontis]